MNYRSLLASFIVSAALTTCADASLIGDNIHATAFNTFLNSNIIDTSAIVTDPGLEFTTGGQFTFAADFAADSVTLTEFFDNPTLLGIFYPTIWTFTDLDWVGQPGAIIDVVQQNPGISPPTVSLLGPDSFSITLPEISLSAMESASYTFDIVTTHTSVPEPSSFALWSLLSLTYVGLRRRRSADKF